MSMICKASKQNGVHRSGRRSLIEVKLEVEATANLHLAGIAIAFDRAEEG